MGVASALLLRQSILGGNRSSSSRIFGKAERREISSLLTADSKQHLRMLCFGYHWNLQTGQYEKTRANHDGAKVPPVQLCVPQLRRHTSRTS